MLANVRAAHAIRFFAHAQLSFKVRRVDSIGFTREARPSIATYASGLLTPGVIGGIASASSLTTSFCVVAALVGIIALAAGVLRRGD